MKWTNKGHQFDDAGEYFKNTKVVYFYGCIFTFLNEIIEQLIWAEKKSNNGKVNLDFVFVDRDKEKQKQQFFGYPVISPEEFHTRFADSNDIVILAVTEKSLPKLLAELLTNMKFKRRFNVFTPYEFFRYLTVFIWYRYNKLFFHIVDMYAHTNCNLNCKHCFIQTYRGVRKTINFDLLKKNIQNFFNKIDYTYTFIGGIGDGFAYRDLGDMIDFLNQNYKDRYEKIDIVTNGTIIPNEKLLNALKTPKVHVIVDDYRENVELARKNFQKVISLLEQNKIFFDILKRSYFDKAGLLVKDKNTLDSEENLILQHDNCICHAKGFPYFGYKDGKNYIYSCCFSTINSYLNLIEEMPNDYIDLVASPTDILEFILGYSDNGYLNTCKYCVGIFEGEMTEKIPVAIQMDSKEEKVI